MQAADALQRQRHVVQRARPHPADLHHLAEVAQRETVVALAQADQPQVEARVGVGGLQLGHAPELARALLVHPRLVEGDPQVAVLVDARPRHLLHLRRPSSDRVREARLDQAEERLAHVELHHPAVVDHVLHAAPAVHQRQDLALLVAELEALDRLGAGHVEDQLERGDLLLDQAPLVDAPGALQQEVLGVDRHQHGPLLGALVGLELEAPLVPGEEEVDRLLDLDADLALQLLAGDVPAAHQDLAQPVARRLRLLVDGGEEVFARGAAPFLTSRSPSRSRRFTIEA